MGVSIKREDPKPSTEPVETVTLTGPGSRKITVRPGSTGKSSMRTVVLSKGTPDTYAYTEIKWSVMLGDLRTFGQALIDIADGK